MITQTIFSKSPAKSNSSLFCFKPMFVCLFVFIFIKVFYRLRNLFCQCWIKLYCISLALLCWKKFFLIHIFYIHLLFLSRVVALKIKSPNKYNCSGPTAFKSQRVGYQSNQKLLPRYQHYNNQLYSYIHF